MEQQFRKQPMGLIGEEWRIFLDSLIKANDLQLDHMESLIKKEQLKRWNVRGEE